MDIRLSAGKRCDYDRSGTLVRRPVEQIAATMHTRGAGYPGWTSTGSRHRCSRPASGRASGTGVGIHEYHIDPCRWVVLLDGVDRLDHGDRVGEDAQGYRVPVHESTDVLLGLLGTGGQSPDRRGVRRSAVTPEPGEEQRA